MSEHDPLQLAEALGSEAPIYVGLVTIIDLAAGNSKQKVEVHKAARALATEAEPTDVVATTIGKLAALIDPQPEPVEDLSTLQKDAIADNIITLAKIHLYAEVADTPTKQASVVRRLCNLYFDHQNELTETSAGHYLRVAPDDYALSIGFDLDEAWKIFEQSQEAHRPR